jgi:cardiolipin synthase (CMP-forming)
MSHPSIKPVARPAATTMSLWHLFNTPNILTLSRVFSVPVFLGLVSKDHYRYALYVFLFAALTDSLDGTVARWFDCKTEIGAFLDPFADKLLLLSAFIALTFENSLPAWLLGVVVIRDVAIVFGYFLFSFITNEHIPVRPSYLGKTSTVLQLSCIIAALIRHGAAWPREWDALLYATAISTALTGMQYAYRGLVWLSSREPEMFN